LATADDRDVSREHGLAAMRQGRLARLARQAQVQGGLLTVEELAYLTCSSTATVRRDLAACRDNGVAVPTRGQIRDIGPGIPHKTQVVQLYLWGLQFTEIERRTRHSEMRSAATCSISVRSRRCTHGARRSPRSALRPAVRRR
jgi:hypothetical protein